MDENKQYFSSEFYYLYKETNIDANFCWEEPEAKQGSQEEIEAFLIGQKLKVLSSDQDPT